jgi:hypothetical protein
MYKEGTVFTASPMDRLEAGRLGVRTYLKDEVWPGYTLFSPAFGSTEYLIDMNGMVVHTWPCVHSQLGELLPDGNLLVDDYGHGLSERSPSGEIVWSWKGPYHHDFEGLPGGNVVLLLARDEEPIPGFYAPGFEPETMRTDVVAEVTRSGEIAWEFSFGDHVKELRDLAGLPWPVRYVQRDPSGEEREVGSSDWAHTNTIEILPDTALGRKDDRFRGGNLLFSFRALDIIGVIDREKELIVWAWGLGELDGQHQPTMLDDGRILIFDNGTYRGNSRVVELDPWGPEVVWEYQLGSRFYSPFRSGVQGLPNGNVLVCESDAGRIFEVTRSGEVVWDYWSPFLGQGEGNQGRHIYRATRYSEEEVKPLFSSRRERITAVADGSGRRLETFGEALRFYQSGLDP